MRISSLVTLLRAACSFFSDLYTKYHAFRELLGIGGTKYCRGVRLKEKAVRLIHYISSFLYLT